MEDRREKEVLVIPSLCRAWRSIWRLCFGLAAVSGRPETGEIMSGRR